MSAIPPAVAEWIRKLSPRERDVLEKFAKGLDNGAIATELNIAESTVRAHVKNLRAKTKARNDRELTLLAFVAGTAAAT